MSQSGGNQRVNPDAQPAQARAADQDVAVQAVINHHALLAAGLDTHVEALLGLVETDQLLKATAARQELLDFVRREILPHARAEEQALYPPAAALPQGRLLVAGMLAEHQALTELVDEIAQTGERAGGLVRAAAAARAFAAVFATHLAKENTLVLPLLVAAEVSLPELLAGMHELLGTDAADTDADAEASGGCGCGGCGCGGDRDTTAAGAAAPVLSVDARLDVREVPHGQRHALVLSTVDALTPGQAVVLVASHAPRPVLVEIDDRFGGQIQAQWLQSGPDVWQIRLERSTVVA